MLKSEEMNKIQKVINIYNMYDDDDISDKKAISLILDIIDDSELQPEFEKLSKKYDNGDIDSGEQLMRIMNIIEKKYPEIYQ
jgi:hypothetical protein